MFPILKMNKCNQVTSQIALLFYSFFVRLPIYFAKLLFEDKNDTFFEDVDLVYAKCCLLALWFMFTFSTYRPCSFSHDSLGFKSTSGTLSEFAEQTGHPGTHW